MTHTASIFLAIFFFLAPLLYKGWNKEQIELADLGKCAIAAMGLPNLLVCFYYLIVNKEEALKMAEVSQYLTIGVLITFFLIYSTIAESFKKPNNP